MKHKIQKWLCQEPEKNSQETATTLMAPIKPLTEETAQKFIKQINEVNKKKEEFADVINRLFATPPTEEEIIFIRKQRNKNKSGLYPGYKTTTGFTLMREITTLDQFWRAINTEKSIFARHRMYPTAFFFSWQIKTIKDWIDAGRFYIATREEGKNKDQEEEEQ